MTADPPESTEEPLQAFNLDKLRNQEIEVISNGILYQGILIGADDSDLFLKGRLRWLILPLDRITSLRLAGSRISFDPRKQVEANFYAKDLDEPGGG